MPLSSGDKLGPYQILAPLGAGGMGEVYRARDTKLDRDVAIKVLPHLLANDPERLARFEREAKVLASLNHPNIAQIYGVEDRALVMELVPGETLKGPLPLEDALRIFAQIADALEAAHEKGITHRDLKPANIMITPAGVVKVLDFGLAAVAPASDVAPASAGDSPTLTIRATQAGMIMGTAGYMSPEQASGKPVDKRADIWSFGVVLWEMLTGHPLFEGETISHTLADVLRGPIDFDKLPKETPPAIRDLLRRCLDRNVKTRLRDIGEARIVLTGPVGQVHDLSATGRGPVPPRRSRLAWSVAAALAVIAVVVSFLHFRETPPPERTLRYTIVAPESSILHSFSVSPDGRYVALAATVQGKTQLWLRPLDALQAQPMPGSEGATYPFWSPDSRYIGFFAQGKLKKIAASGGLVQSLCNAADGRGGSWSREDMIVFSPTATDTAILQVPASGGVPSDATKTRGTYRFPVFLPTGRHFLYLVIAATPEKNGVYLSSLDGSENRRLLPDTSSVVFATSAPGSHAGHLLFIRENTLLAQPFDAGSTQPSGEVIPIAESVSFASVANFAPVTVSENGMLLYASASSIGSNQIVWFDRAGKLLGPVGAPGNVGWPSISPDEKLVGFSRGTGFNSDIWLRDLARGTDTRFTFDASQNVDPFWSPNGDRIVFRSTRGGSADLYQKASNGSGQDQLLFANAYNKVPDQWSRDGRFIVYSDNGAKTKWDLWVLPIGTGTAGGTKPVPFLQTEFNEFEGQLSPDSRWMAYASEESGQREVYVRPFPTGDGKWRISTAGGDQPRWRGDGKEMFFVGADGKMTAVTVKAAAGPKLSFEAGTPVPLFDPHIVATPGIPAFEYDVTAGGKRFLVDTNTATASAPPLNVVVNWNAGLKK
jgi:serine/threonine protein kinase